LVNGPVNSQSPIDFDFSFSFSSFSSFCSFLFGPSPSSLSKARFFPFFSLTFSSFLTLDLLTGQIGSLQPFRTLTASLPSFLLFFIFLFLFFFPVRFLFLLYSNPQPSLLLSFHFL
jgi:hypothetical protein